MKKRITFFTLHLGYGGVEKAVTTLANELCNKFDIEIIATYKLFDKPAFPLNDKVKVKYLINNNLPLRLSGYRTLLKNRHVKTLIKVLWEDYLCKFKIITLVKDFKRGMTFLKKKEKRNLNEVKKCKSEIIISTTPYLNGLVSKYGNKESLKIGWEHNHHHNNKTYIKSIVDTSYGLDKFIVVSEKLACFYSKILSCEVLSISNFLDFIPDETTNLNKNNIITVGRLSDEKGVIDLIKVFNYINKLNTNITYNIIGDGQEKSNIEKEIKKYHLEDKIIMHGYQEQAFINEMYIDSGFYLMGSKTESFGLVLAEAMSYGVPCIAFTSAEGANDLIMNGVNGFLVHKRDYKYMAKCVVNALNDEKFLKQLSNNAKRISKSYDKDNAIKEWLKILKK